MISDEDYISKTLDVMLFSQSMEGKVLQVLPGGYFGGWLLKQDGVYQFDEDFRFGFNFLEKYDGIQKQMLSKTLLLFYSEEYYWATLSTRKRTGGYKEPLEEVICFSAKATSIETALSLLEQQIIDFYIEDCDMDLEDVQLKRNVVKDAN